MKFETKTGKLFVKTVMPQCPYCGSAGVVVDRKAKNKDNHREEETN